ncbi:MAG TPA: folylpolyglutamate synthase/dihydrofolate synthase family protein [Candidatus Cloacimonadota bacterium]|nr:folylpolyglutamate synthase/dihydrofolate synthase family protein [Candidatus Cloacimonadota bacterium]
MNYQEFLDHIYQKYSGNVKLELDRMVGLLKDMGSPQQKLSGFHIAGTNGKGSVCATLEALAMAHGLSTGLNTSPHLIDYTERFRIDGQELSFQRVLDTFLRYEDIFEKWSASFFEISTAIAFAVFAEEQLDCSIIEVGLGGRLDATNLFTPDVTAITTIGLDHVKTLGGTLELIAAEKAGIIKRGVPLVLGSIEPSPLHVIMKVAEGKGVPIYRWGLDYLSIAGQDNIAGICFDYYYEDIGWKDLRANLMGEHQAVNLATALTCFIQYAAIKGFEVSEPAVRNALMNINWRGRMQVLSIQPPIILDGAHNLHGIQALVKTLDKAFPGKKINFVISILADKDYRGMIELICSRAARIYVAQNQSDRAASAEDQLAEIGKHAVPATAYPSVAEAYAQAVAELGPDDVLICGGSLYTVGEVLTASSASPA